MQFSTCFPVESVENLLFLLFWCAKLWKIRWKVVKTLFSSHYRFGGIPVEIYSKFQSKNTEMCVNFFSCVCNFGKIFVSI